MIRFFVNGFTSYALYRLGDKKNSSFVPAIFVFMWVYFYITFLIRYIRFNLSGQNKYIQQHHIGFHGFVEVRFLLKCPPCHPKRSLIKCQMSLLASVPHNIELLYMYYRPINCQSCANIVTRSLFLYSFHLNISLLDFF